MLFVVKTMVVSERPKEVAQILFVVIKMTAERIEGKSARCTAAFVQDREREPLIDVAVFVRFDVQRPPAPIDALFAEHVFNGSAERPDGGIIIFTVAAFVEIKREKIAFAAGFSVFDFGVVAAQCEEAITVASVRLLEILPERIKEVVFDAVRFFVTGNQGTNKELLFIRLGAHFEQRIQRLPRNDV